MIWVASLEGTLARLAEGYICIKCHGAGVDWWRDRAPETLEIGCLTAYNYPQWNMLGGYDGVHFVYRYEGATLPSIGGCYVDTLGALTWTRIPPDASKPWMLERPVALLGHVKGGPLPWLRP